MSKQDEAVELFKEGCACSQAVFGAYCEDLGLDRLKAFKIASGFAGGMRKGEVCGAVTGSLMVLGLKYATDDCDKRDSRLALYSLVRDFEDRFISLNKTIICRELLGCDISTPDGMKEATDKNLFKTTCAKLVRDAAAILDGMIDD